MSNEMITRAFEGHDIRMQQDDQGETWFCANDVCGVLGYGNPRDSLAKHVDEDDVAKRDTIDSVGRRQQTNFINESGLYSLIMGSKLPSAKKFKHWVTSEVLLSIRKKVVPHHRTKEQDLELFESFKSSLCNIGTCDDRIEDIALDMLKKVNPYTEVSPMLKEVTDAEFGDTMVLARNLEMDSKKVDRILYTMGFQKGSEHNWVLCGEGKKFGHTYGGCIFWHIEPVVARIKRALDGYDSRATKGVSL